MAENLRFIDLPMPWRGIDTDSNALTAPPDTGQRVDNFIPGVPGQLPARRGFVDMGILRPSGTPVHSNLITQMIPSSRYGNYVLIGAAANTGTTTQWPFSYVSMYQTDGNPALSPGYAPGANFTPFMQYYNIDSSVAASTSAIDNAAFPDTQHTTYEGFQFWTAGANITYPTKKSNSATLASRRLVKWAGIKPDLAVVARNVTVNNGSPDVTLGVSYTPSLAGYIMRIDAGPATPGYWYGYEVIAHTPATTAVTLAEPYGLGEAASLIPNVAGAAATFRPMDVVYNSPLNSTCCINHLDRIFVGRPETKTAVGSLQPRKYPMGIQWSEPGQPEKWPDTNILVLGGDPNDMIMGFGVVGRTLIVFSKRTTMAITGDSESTFSVTTLSNSFGCADSRSIVYWKNNIIWASRAGIHMMGPDLEITDLTRHGGGRSGGISDDYIFQVVALVPSSATTEVHTAISSHVEEDYLIVVVDADYSYELNGYATVYMCHIPSRSWATINKFSGSYPTLLRYIGQVQWPTRAKRIVAATHMCYVNLSNILPYSGQASSTPYSHVYQDSSRQTTAGTVVEVPMTTRAETQWHRLAGGDAFAVRRANLQHGWMFAAPSSQLSVDPKLDVSAVSSDDVTGTVGTILPRRYGGVSSSAGAFSDELRSSAFPPKAYAIRFVFSGTLTSSVTIQSGTANRSMDMRLHSVRVAFEAQRQGYNQVMVA